MYILKGGLVGSGRLPVIGFVGFHQRLALLQLPDTIGMLADTIGNACLR